MRRQRRRVPASFTTDVENLGHGAFGDPTRNDIEPKGKHRGAIAPPGVISCWHTCLIVIHSLSPNSTPAEICFTCQACEAFGHVGRRPAISCCLVCFETLPDY